MISVIVPIFNAEKYLEECVYSIQNQIYSDLEIILIDDGSTDNSNKLCHSLALNDERIQVITGENQGVSCARNKGIIAAKGEYIAFIDADDTVEEDFFIDMLEISSQGYDMVFCNYAEIDNYGNRIVRDQLSRFDRDSIEAGQLILNLISVSDDSVFGSIWRVLFKSKLIKEHQLLFEPELTMSEDLHFILRCLRYVKRVGIQAKALYNYRIHDFSTTGISKYRKNLDCNMNYLSRWMKAYTQEYPERRNLNINLQIWLASVLVSRVANVCQRGTPYSLKERLNYAYRYSRESTFKNALKTASMYRERISKKRYVQILFLLHHLAFLNVIFYSIKNKTLTRIEA